MEVNPGIVFSSFTKILPVRLLQEKIARAPCPCRRSRGRRARRNPEIACTCFFVSFAGNQQLRAFLQIFRRVIVEFAVRNDFAGDGGARDSSLPSTDTSISRAADCAFDHNLQREFSRQIHRRGKFSCAAFTRVIPTDDPSVAGFTNSGKRNFFLIALQHFRAVVLPLRAPNRPGTARSAIRPAQTSASAHLYPCPRPSQHARAHVRQPRKLEQPLHRAVFAKRAVQHRETPHPRVTLGCPAPLRQRNQRRRGRIGRQRTRARPISARPASIFCAPRADEPAAVFRDADGHRFIFFRIERADHRGRRSERNFMLARAPAKKHAHAQPFLRKFIGAALSRDLRTDTRIRTHRIFFPSPESTISTPSSAVVLCRSITGLISTSFERNHRLRCRRSFPAPGAPRGT